MSLGWSITLAAAALIVGFTAGAVAVAFYAAGVLDSQDDME